MKTAVRIAALLMLSASLALAQAPNEGAPNWWNIEQQGSPVDYRFYYTSVSTPTQAQNCDGSHNCEFDGETSNYHPPMELMASSNNYSVPTGDWGNCPIVDNDYGDGIYYIDPSTGQDISGTYPSTTTSNFTISQAYSGVKGMTTQAAVFGNATSSPANSYGVAAVYVTNHHCSDANTEYGWFVDPTGHVPLGRSDSQPDTMFFYYSIHTNCDGNGECRSGSPSGPPVYQQTSAFTVINNISGDPNNMYWRSAYIIPYGSGHAFRLQVLTQGEVFASCDINYTYYQNCEIDVPIDESWYPTQDVINQAYLVAAVQTSANPAPYISWGDFGINLQGVYFGF